MSKEESYMADCSICKEETFHSNEFDGWVRCSICALANSKNISTFVSSL